MIEAMPTGATTKRDSNAASPTLMQRGAATNGPGNFAAPIAPEILAAMPTP